MSEEETPDRPLGFNIQPTEDGLFALAVTGASSWYMTGFASRQAAHDWVLDYLTTMSENVSRLNIELAERQAVLAREQELKRMEILAQYPTTGTKH
jgi:RNA-splicing ligase RtcB